MNYMLRSPCKRLLAVRIRWRSQEDLASAGKLVGRHCSGLSDGRDSSEERGAQLGVVRGHPIAKGEAAVRTPRLRGYHSAWMKFVVDNARRVVFWRITDAFGVVRLRGLWLPKGDKRPCT